MKKQILLAVAAMLAGTGMMSARVEASAATRLATAPDGLMAPVWSPDGSKIAASGSNYAGIFVFDADGTAGRQLTNAEGAGYKMAWSADSRTITARTNERQGARVMHSLVNYNVATGASTAVQQLSRKTAMPQEGTASNLFNNMVSDAAGVAQSIPALSLFAGRTVINPALSPDGKRIAFQVVGRGMWVINTDGSGLTELGKGSHPAWLPDGKTIVFTRVQDNGSTFTASEIYTVSLDNLKHEMLVSDTNLIPLTPAVSPDGTRLVFENAADNALYIVKLTNK